MFTELINQFSTKIVLRKFSIKGNHSIQKLICSTQNNQSKEARMNTKLIDVVLIFTLACFALASRPGTSNNYIETGECEEAEQVCSYSYSAQQEFFDDGKKQSMSVNATVDVTCSSSGVYNESDAKLYCMDIEDASITTNLLENSTDEEIRAIQQSLNEQLANWFCFVQSSNGKVPAVYHSTSEAAHIVSLKKAIAAAFQANFEGTEEEEETDPQSRHKSHYTYTPISEVGVIKMKRSVRRPDVNEYSNEAPVVDIDTSKDEEIEYQARKLQRSSGITSFHLANDSLDDTTDLESISLTEMFSASGSYSLVLESCSEINRYAYRVRRKRIMSEMKSSKQEDLKATVDKEKEGFEKMRLLRERLPSGSALKALQNYEEYGDNLVSVLQLLIELESQYGALPLYIPVIDDVMTFITKMPATTSDKNVREAVIMILTDEGSLRSQMALLSAYDNAMDSTEANTILMHISFMENVRIGFVIGMEERLGQVIADSVLADQLLLVFASLATKGSDEVEDRIMSYLAKRVTQIVQAEGNVADIVLLLHALGNTGSKSSIALIFSILDSSTNHDEYGKIKLVTIESLIKVTDDSVVLSKLEELLQDDSSIDCTTTILETLENGLEYVTKRKLDIEQYITFIKNHPLIYSLIEVVASSNNSELYFLIKHYLVELQADETHFDLLYRLVDSHGLRARRGTDWDAYNGDYDLVSSRSQRQSDVSTYSRHNAYINSKRIGIDEANLKIAYGYFAGTNTHCDSMKLYGRTKVVATLLSHSATYADIKVDIRATTTSASISTYARIGSNTLLDYSTQRSITSHCFPYSRRLAEYRRRLFNLSFSLFIYVASLTLHVGVDVHFNMDINTNMCIGRNGLEATGALATLTPTFGVTVTGGVSAGLLYLVRGGIDVSVTLNYRLEPAVSVQGCTAYCSLSGRLRLGLFDSYPDSDVNLYAWWQHQSVGFCGSGWFRYPCLKWSRKHRWDSLSASWSLSRDRRSIREYCTGYLHPQCTEGALDSSFFNCA